MINYIYSLSEFRFYFIPLNKLKSYLFSLFLILIIFFSACNSKEGVLPEGEQLVYPELKLDKVGEAIFDIGGNWSNVDFKKYQYEGHRPLLFIEIIDHIAAIDIKEMGVRWIIPKTIFGSSHSEDDRVVLFDWQDHLMVTNGKKWSTMNPETGLISKSYDIRDYYDSGEYYFGYNFIGGKCYMYTIGSDYRESYVYDVDFSSERVTLVQSFGLPFMTISEHSPRLFPYDETENRLLLPFPLLGGGQSRGAYFPFLNPQTHEIDSHYLSSETFVLEELKISSAIEYDDNLLSFRAGSAVVCYSLKNNHKVFEGYGINLKREGDFVVGYDNTFISASKLQKGSKTLLLKHPSDFYLPPVKHPTKDIIAIPYQNRILLVELHGMQLLMEHSIEQGGLYEAVFFDSEGHLCILDFGSEKRLDFFDLPI